jgi:hypothetical protein
MVEPPKSPEEQPAKTGEPTPDAATSFFETLRIGVLTSFPALSALIFVIVAVKVFRASIMESTTTVAIVSTADIFVVLKGVILTLLPGFLAGLTAASIWWWANVLPERGDGEQPQEAAKRALLAPQAALAWSLTVMAFFTIWWPVFLILLVPVLATTVALVPQALGLERADGAKTPPGAVLVWGVAPALAIDALLVTKAVGAISWPAFIIILTPALVIPAALIYGWVNPGGAGIPLRRTLKSFGLVAAAVFIGVLTLSSSVWLPLRLITLTGTPPTLKHHEPLPHQFAAFVLSRDSHGASLLLNSPRAVVQVGPNDIAKEMPLCVPPESAWRVLTTRASQVLGFDADPHAPYATCPDMPQRLLGG